MRISSRRTEPAMQRIESEAVRELIRSGPIDAHCSGIRKPNDPKHASRQVIVKSTHQISLLWKVLRLGLGLGRRLGALPPPPSGRLRRRRLRLGRIASSTLRLARVSGRRLGRRALLTPRPRHRFRLLGLALGWDWDLCVPVRSGGGGWGGCRFGGSGA